MEKRILVGITVIGLALLGWVIYDFSFQEKDLPIDRKFGPDNHRSAFDEGKINNEETEYVVDRSDYIDEVVLLNGLEVGDELTEAEKTGLLLMREEEKLARDVYSALYEKWGMRVFDNIAASEDTHTKAVSGLIERYGLTDPVTIDQEGVFQNLELQKLYTDLVGSGSKSVEEAYRVGALIEDLDIADLERLIAETDKVDIKVVYENLQRGSRNHLRAFSRQISGSGLEYKPTYISEEIYLEIINSNQERGR